MHCALCLFIPGDRQSEDPEAITVLKGYALCEDHAGMFTSELAHHIMKERELSDDA